MVLRTPPALAALYAADETAWLEQSAELIRAGRFHELDTNTLAEYLTDMAKRDRREVLSWLIVLMAHQLKWDYQPGGRCASWRGTLREQRRELRQLLESGTLRNYAEQVLAEAFVEARAQAADETDLNVSIFPKDNPWGLDMLLTGTEHQI
jgi:hypothetical protein